MRVEGRVALVTGASRGIGAGIARCMAQEGAAVVVNYVQSEALANEVVKEIRAGGGSAIAIQADVGNYAQVKSMVERSIAEFGKVDILVNNAGIAGPSVPMADVTPKEFEEVVRNHLIGSFNCTQCLLHHMRGLGGGDVIFISSRQTSFYPPNSSPYNAAKGGMDGLAQGLAKEERYNGIRGERSCPGLVPTDILMKDLMETTGKSSVEEVDKVMPFGRMLRPEDIGNLCTFLASEQGSHISGEVDLRERGSRGRATVFLRERAEALLRLTGHTGLYVHEYRIKRIYEIRRKSGNSQWWLQGHWDGDSEVYGTGGGVSGGELLQVRGACP